MSAEQYSGWMQFSLEGPVEPSAVQSDEAPESNDAPPAAEQAEDGSTS